MNYKLYIQTSNKKYLTSLKRFLSYLLNIKSTFLDRKQKFDESIILIDEDVPIDDEWLAFYIKCSNVKIIILGHTRKSNEYFINLLNFSNLKCNIKFAINHKKSNVSPLLMLKNVKQEISSLFKGHGDKSFFNLLNMTRQAIINGTDLLKEGLLDREEYNESYLNPGLKNWEAFKIEFKKYEEYLKAFKFDSEVSKLKYNIIKFQLFINKLKHMTKEQINNMSDKEFIKYTDNFNHIDNILSKIKQKIDSLYIYNGK